MSFFHSDSVLQIPRLEGVDTDPAVSSVFTPPIQIVSVSSQQSPLERLISNSIYSGYAP